MNYMTFHDFIPWIVIYTIALLVGIMGLGAIISELNKRYQRHMDSIQKKHHDDVERIDDDIGDLKDQIINIINVLTLDENDNPKVIQLSGEDDIDYQLKRKYGYVLTHESEIGAIYKLYIDEEKIQTIQITLVEGKPSVGFINEMDNFNQYVPIGALRLLWLKYTYLKAKYHWVDDVRR